jgi:hypothetical protein
MGLLDMAKLSVLIVAIGIATMPELGIAQERATGLVFLDDAQYRSIPLATAPITGQLPASSDSAADFPEAGNQGEQASCAAWAVAYGLKSFQKRRERGWSLTDPGHLFSPAFIYDQLHRSADCSGGLNYEDVLNLVRRDGVAPLSLMPYSATSCLATINSFTKQAAKEFAIADWRRVNVQDETEVKSHVAAGFPVLLRLA